MEGNIFSQENFVDDNEKMLDFREMSKDAFLDSYSYLTEEEYDNTKKIMEIKDFFNSHTISDVVDYLTKEQINEFEMNFGELRGE